VIALDTQVIREQQVKIQLTKVEEKLKATKEELKSKRQSLESTRQALSKCEVSSSMMIASVVANATALFKSHIPDLDMEILHKDFPIDDV
jgi:enoyl-[acyl-carrier-protein] reductase (NADH)